MYLTNHSEWSSIKEIDLQHGVHECLGPLLSVSYASRLFDIIDNNQKDGGCTFYQNSLRSEIV